MAEELNKPFWRRVWIACAILSVLLIAIVSIDDTINRARSGTYQAAQRKARADFPAAVAAWRVEEKERPLMAGGESGRARIMNRQEVEARLFPGGAPATLPSTDPANVIWRDDKRGVIFDFRFRADGTWSSLGLSTIYPPPPAPTRIKVWREQFEPLRHWWTAPFKLSAGPILWFVLLATTTITRRHHFAHATLLVGWLCFLGWFLHPNYHGIRGMFSNDMLFWGTCMMIMSVFAFRPATRPKPDPSRCSNCGYDLTGNVSGVCPECGTPIAHAS